jgi:adenosylhomocysteine nucleosidase
MRAIIHKFIIAGVILASYAALAGERCVVAVLVTREVETAALTSILGGRVTNGEVLAGRDVISITNATMEIITARCGAGIVNGVITAQSLIDRFRPDLLVSMGLCAAVDDSLAIGDLVVAQSFDRHDVGTHTDAGFVHGTAWYRKTSFDAPSLMGGTSAWNSVVEKAFVTITGGMHRVCLVTGDSFIRSPLKRSWIRQKLGAQVVDMSGAAIAATAQANNIPLVVLRQVSDYGDAAAGGTFAESASESAVDLANAAVSFVNAWCGREERTW